MKRKKRNLLTYKEDPGYFNLMEVSERMDKFVRNGFYPTLDEFWEFELSNLPPDQSSSIHIQLLNAKFEFNKKIYRPSLQEALARRTIKKLSKDFALLEITDDEDRNGKIDLRVLHPFSGEEIIIQCKSSVQPFGTAKFVHEQSVPQMRYFNRTAEYLIVSFDESSLPNCSFQYTKHNKDILNYEMDDIDIMLGEMLDEQARKQRI